MNTNGNTISVKPQQEFTIRLASTPSTGYQWQVETQPPQIELLSTSYEHPQGQAPIGASGTEVFRFRSTVPGQYTVLFALKRSWEATAVKQSAFTINVA